jgi:acetyl-CoA carboxylase biotin carboxylase subunit
MPQAGTVLAWQAPRGVRVEHALHAGIEVAPYYDSMIAKVIVHGRDRAESIARMKRVLSMTVIEGIKTSIPLHLRILADADFQAGRLSTGFMERLLAQPAPQKLAESA